MGNVLWNRARDRVGLLAQVDVSGLVGLVYTPLELRELDEADALAGAADPVVWVPYFARPQPADIDTGIVDPSVLLGFMLVRLVRATFLSKQLSIPTYGKDTFISTKLGKKVDVETKL